jgi:hypothetical protein
MRRDRLHAFRPFHFVLLLGLGIVFVKVVRRIKLLWIAQSLSLAVVVSLVEVTCYYYSMFILSALLSRLRRGVEQWVLCVAGISQLLAVNRFVSYYYDDRYTAQSVLFCLFAVTLLFAYWPKSKQVETAKQAEPVESKASLEAAKPTLDAAAGAEAGGPTAG